MKLLTPALLAATALSVTLPTVAEGQSYQARSYQGGSYQDCESSRQNRQVAGALIGGILGAVIGNELADDSNNNRHGRPDRWDRRARWDDYRRHGRGYYGRHNRRYEHRDRGNAEEVGTIAGAGVGALIGAGIAGGEDCGTVRRTGGGYAGKPDGYYGDDRYYDDSGYYQDDRYYSDDAGYAGDPYYDDRYGSSGELLGGPDRGEPARTYSASSTYSNASAAGNCQWSQTRRMGEYGQAVTDRVWMCQGADGIWRPADTYGQ
ncbi:MAG: hypothetical protein U9P68_03645 [Pseudomonadota bacterium]|nr:hypothetical protein [Pseudomonadota bacterium]